MYISPDNRVYEKKETLISWSTNTDCYAEDEGMNILILNGAPAGDSSITLQTMLYIQKYFPDQTYEQLNVGLKIKAIERDFSEVQTFLEKADLLVFSYPVYTFLVPSQLHRFIELIKEHGVQLDGKYATQISTSKHFYDTTAHEFIRENCVDFHLKYIRGLSADMEDLLKKKGQKEALDFFRHVIWSIENGVFESGPKDAVTKKSLKTASLPASDAARSKDGSIALVTDLEEGSKELKGEIPDFSEEGWARRKPKKK